MQQNANNFQEDKSRFGFFCSFHLPSTTPHFCVSKWWKQLLHFINGFFRLVSQLILSEVFCLPSSGCLIGGEMQEILLIKHLCSIFLAHMFWRVANFLAKPVQENKTHHLIQRHENDLQLISLKSCCSGFPFVK